MADMRIPEGKDAEAMAAFMIEFSDQTMTPEFVNKFVRFANRGLNGAPTRAAHLLSKSFPGDYREEAFDVARNTSSATIEVARLLVGLSEEELEDVRELMMKESLLHSFRRVLGKMRGLKNTERVELARRCAELMKSRNKDLLARPEAGEFDAPPRRFK